MAKGLRFVPGFWFEKDVGYIDFLNRVHSEELKLRELGLWDVPHPWLNLFLPKSRIADFDSGVFKGILLKQSVTTGLVIIYPMNRNKYLLLFSFFAFNLLVHYYIYLGVYNIYIYIKRACMFAGGMTKCQQ